MKCDFRAAKLKHRRIRILFRQISNKIGQISIRIENVGYYFVAIDHCHPYGAKRTGRKLDPKEAEKRMQEAKNDHGARLVASELLHNYWQIASYFSRIAHERRLSTDAGTTGATVADETPDNDDQNEIRQEYDFQDEPLCVAPIDELIVQITEHHNEIRYSDC